MTTLRCDDVTVAFGGVRAVDRVSVEVSAGEVVGLIGSNGAGKTTLFEVLSGYLRPDSGRVMLDGEDVTGLPVHRRARRGVARGFQDARLFPAMSVEDVVSTALDVHTSDRVDLAGLLLGLPSARRAQSWTDTRAGEVVESFGLEAYRDHAVGELSTGTRRVLEIACVFAQEPALVLLDEPSAGVAAKEAEALRGLLRRLQTDGGAAMLLVEHDVPMVMELSDRIYVMETGAILAEGPPDEIAANPEVIEAYFGTRTARR